METNPQLQNTLIKLLQKKNVVKVKQFIKENNKIDLNTYNDGRNPLVVAINNNLPSYFLYFLINYGADVNLRIGQNQHTLLILAVSKNSPAMVEVLLKNGADVNAANSNGETALMYACRINAETKDCIKLLLNYHADVHLVDSQGKTALMYSLANDYPEHTQLLLENFTINQALIIDLVILWKNRIHINQKALNKIFHWKTIFQTDHEGHHALYWAFRHGHEANIQLLLNYYINSGYAENILKENNLPFNYTSTTNSNAYLNSSSLLLSSSNNSTPIVPIPRKVPNSGGLRHLRGRRIILPVKAGSTHSDLGTQKYLTSVYPSSQSTNGLTNRTTSTSSPSIQPVKKFNFIEILQEPLVVWSVKRDFYDLTQTALKIGFSVRVHDRLGQSPLMMAIDHHHPQMMELLLNYGAPLNQVNTEGDTALYKAIQHSEDMVRLFLNHKTFQHQSATDEQLLFYKDIWEGRLTPNLFLNYFSSTKNEIIPNTTSMDESTSTKSTTIKTDTPVILTTTTTTSTETLVTVNSPLTTTALIDSFNSAVKTPTTPTTPCLPHNQFINFKYLESLKWDGENLKNSYKYFSEDSNKMERSSSIDYHGQNNKNNNTGNPESTETLSKNQYNYKIDPTKQGNNNNNNSNNNNNNSNNNNDNDYTYGYNLYNKKRHYDTLISMAILSDKKALALALVQQILKTSFTRENRERRKKKKKSNDWYSLLYACQYGYVEMVQILLDHFEANVNIKDGNKNSPLILACIHGSGPVVQLLLQHGAEINYQVGFKGYTPLMMACIHGHVEVVDILIENRADLYIRYMYTKTAFLFACENGHKQIVELLLKKSNHHLTYPETDCEYLALGIASQNGDEKIVEYLLRNFPCKVNGDNYKNNPAFSLACANDHINIVNLLLKFNMNVNNVNNRNQTPLMLSSFKGNEELVELLLQHHADINMGDKNDTTALMYASEGGHLNIIQKLIEFNADLNKTDMESYTALMYSCQMGYDKIVELLLAYHANLDIKNIKTGETELIIATKKGYTRIVELLLSNTYKKLNVNHMDMYLNTALHYACIHNYESIVNLLLQNKADINIKNRTKDTALLLAIENNNTEIALRLLEESSIDIHTRNSKGYSAIMLASQKGHEEIIKKLIQMKACLNEIHPYNENTSLLFACQNGHTEVVRELLKNGVDVNVKNIEDYTPLMYACKGGYDEIVQLLIQYGANINYTWLCNTTILMMACETNNKKIVEYLLKNKVDIYYKNKQGLNSIIIANQKENRCISRLLLNYIK